MTLMRRLLPSEISTVGEDEIEVIASTGDKARDGHVLMPDGAQLDDFRKLPMVLWQHMSDQPIGRAEDIRIDGNKIVARIRFAPLGISAKADEIRGLTKAGILGAVSVGFEIIDAAPLDPKKPRGGLLISRWLLLELSVVSVPADTGAVVTARDWATLADSLPADVKERLMARASQQATEDEPEQRAASADWKVGASRDLPIEDSDAWNGPAAEASIFEHAGGDDFDPSEAKKGFLVYNAAEPKLRGSYKLPIATASDGGLKVPKGAIRAAASRLPQTDVPDEVKTSAEAVLNHYKEKAGIGEDQEAKNEDDARAAAAEEQRIAGREAAQAALRARGMYGVASLAWICDELADAVHMAEWEAAMEEDGSPVPAQLKEQLKGLGAVLVAMTQEEVAEMLAGDDDDVGVPMDMMTLSTSPGLTRRIAERAGKAVSAATKAKMDEASGHHAKAMDHMGDAQDAHAKAMDSHDEMGDALDAGDLDKARAAHANMKGNLGAMGDAHRGCSRSVLAAERCVRAVTGVDTDAAEDNVPMAGEHAVSDEWAKRQAEKQALRAA